MRLMRCLSENPSMSHTRLTFGEQLCVAAGLTEPPIKCSPSDDGLMASTSCITRPRLAIHLTLPPLSEAQCVSSPFGASLQVSVDSPPSHLYRRVSLLTCHGRLRAAQPAIPPPHPALSTERPIASFSPPPSQVALPLPSSSLSEPFFLHPPITSIPHPARRLPPCRSPSPKPRPTSSISL